MNITDLVLKKINIPFKVSFKHSSATRSATQTIWVEARSDNGTTGYGEGCPREYVTNESIETAVRFFNDNSSRLKECIHNIDDLRLWNQTNKEKIDSNPAAWCAIELAILDVMAKEQRCSIEKLLAQPEITSPFRYSAVLGDSGAEVFEKQLAQYVAMGFTDFKIKISGNGRTDTPKLNLLLQSGSNLRVRVDANNLWRESDEAIRYLSTIPYPLFGIEEPLHSGRYDELKKIGQHLKSNIILDESFLKIDDFSRIADFPSGYIINLRISKMGGLLRSLAIAEKARTSGIKIIIGAQVGETSLLTRAALTVANSYRDILVAQEGAFGTLLLQTDICEPPLMFGKNGQLQFSPREEHGFQLSVQTSNDMLN